MKVVQIDGESLRLEDVEEVASKGAKVRISKKAITKIKKSGKLLNI